MTAAFRRAIAIGLVALTLGACATGVEAAESTAPGVPFGFKVPATKGWTAEVLGGVNPKTGEGAVEIFLRKRGASAFYATRRVTFAESDVTADFGDLGKIEVHSVATGGRTTARSSCGGKPVSFPAGRWEGTISFHGEESFTAFEASAAPADVSFGLDLLCSGEVNEGFGGHSPGALLSVGRRHGAESLELTVRKNKPDGPSRFLVGLIERRGWVSIERVIRSEAGSAAFDYAIPPGLATVRPPRPFSGSLTFSRTGRHKSKVTGNLEVDLPGRADVPILGPGRVQASIQRAVLNPSHPF